MDLSIKDRRLKAKRHLRIRRFFLVFFGLVFIFAAFMSITSIILNTSIIPNTSVIPNENNGHNSGLLHTDNPTKFITVPYINQSTSYPTGCEIVSATMLLQYFSYTVSVDTMIRQYLDTSDITKKDDSVYSGDPNKAFIGTPYSVYSYGCYAPVITTSLNRVLKNGQAAINTTGTALPELVTKYVENNIPIIIWASIDMKETHQTAAWVNMESGETVYWPSGEHCLVLVGYDEDNYYFNDPYKNKGIVKYQKEIVEKRFHELNEQSVVITS